MDEPLYLEDLRPGDSWTSDWREITADDVADFAALTGDHDPLHTDQLIAAESPFGGPVVHGLLGMSVMAGLSSNFPSAATLALVSISDWAFLAPIYFGDSIRVVTQVIETSRHGRRAGRVTWLRQLVNQHDRIVQQGRLVTLVSARTRARTVKSASPRESVSRSG